MSASSPVTDAARDGFMSFVASEYFSMQYELPACLSWVLDSLEREIIGVGEDLNGLGLEDFASLALPFTSLFCSSFEYRLGFLGAFVICPAFEDEKPVVMRDDFE